MLDIGAWDGFFSFECERRGAARVLAIDTFAWDNYGKDGFLLAHKTLNSKVEHRRLAAEDIDVATLGTFDVVLFLGVFYHLRSPISVLERIRGVTAGTLILETHALVPAFHEHYRSSASSPATASSSGSRASSARCRRWRPCADPARGGVLEDRRQAHAVDAVAEEAESGHHDPPRVRPRHHPRLLIRFRSSAGLQACPGRSSIETAGWRERMASTNSAVSFGDTSTDSSPYSTSMRSSDSAAADRKSRLERSFVTNARGTLRRDNMQRTMRVSVLTT